MAWIAWAMFGAWLLGVLLCLWRVWMGPGWGDRAAATLVLAVVCPVFFVIPFGGEGLGIWRWVVAAWPLVVVAVSLAIVWPAGGEGSDG
ncbi:MAG: hypothetical protein R6V58_17340 [Planctomycetota bacterium]